jgi:hypothetical protein
LHTARRRRVEKFLTELETSAAESSSRNPLEQVWTLTEDEFTRRTRSRFSPRIFRTAQDETSAPTKTHDSE